MQMLNEFSTCRIAIFQDPLSYEDSDSLILNCANAHCLQMTKKLPETKKLVDECPYFQEENRHTLYLLQRLLPLK